LYINVEASFSEHGDSSQVHPLEVLVGSIHYWVVSDVVIIATLDGN
jgi:hypothetical protein